MYIYILTCLVNGKQYVGQSVNDPFMANGRIKAHIRGSSGCPIIGRAISKYGWGRFNVEVVGYPGASQESLNEIEAWYIKYLKTLSPNGYNLKISGANGRLSEEVKARMGSKGRKVTDEHKEILSKIHRGKFVSKETRMKISQSLKDKGRPPEVREKIRRTLTGRKHSPETIEKIRLSKINRDRKRKSNVNQLYLF